MSPPASPGGATARDAIPVESSPEPLVTIAPKCYSTGAEPAVVKSKTKGLPTPPGGKHGHDDDDDGVDADGNVHAEGHVHKKVRVFEPIDPARASSEPPLPSESASAAPVPRPGRHIGVSRSDLDRLIPAEGGPPVRVYTSADVVTMMMRLHESVGDTEIDGLDRLSFCADFLRLHGRPIAIRRGRTDNTAQ